MSTEENKALVRRFAEEVGNARNLDVVDELIAPNYVEHSASSPNAPVPMNMPPGREFLKQVFSQHHSAFPDLQYTVELQIAEGDLVMTRVTARGTHLGDWMGIPPTGKQVTWTATHIDRIVNGKSVEHWSNSDDLGRLQQLGGSMSQPATGPLSRQETEPLRHQMGVTPPIEEVR